MLNNEIKEFVDEVFTKIDESIKTLTLCKNFLQGYTDALREKATNYKSELKKLDKGDNINE